MNTVFEHRALDLTAEKLLVYTALSKHLFYFRQHIQKFVLEKGRVPLNPFMTFDYFLLDTLDRDVIREANNNLVRHADEIWVFGSVSNGVLAEVRQARIQGKRVCYFAVRNSREIEEIPVEKVEMENEVEAFRSEL